jgi:RecA-family ATPase
MPPNIELSKTLYERLTKSAQQRGFTNIDQLLDFWQTTEEQRVTRHKIVQQLDQIREQLHACYGEISDSTILIREDRSR